MHLKRKNQTFLQLCLNFHELFKTYLLRYLEVWRPEKFDLFIVLKTMGHIVK